MALLLSALAIGLVAILALGGRLERLAAVRLRGLPLLVASTAIQLSLMVGLVPGVRPLQGALHLASYGLSGAFVVLNRRLPGVLLIGLGGLCNLLPIAANGGVMPASADALSRAGLVAAPRGFSNSIALADPRLARLGDVFAVPESWPLANVFSIGDVLVVAGAIWGLWRLCGSRPLPASLQQFVELRGNRNFVRLWAAQGVSHLGDWVFALAVATSVIDAAGSTRLLATLLVLQVGPSAVVGLFGAPLVDRLPRRALMIGADVARAGAVASLLFVAEPSAVHLGAVAVTLGVMGALFQPSFSATLPNLVPRSGIVAANALVSATFHLAIMAGPVLGAVIVVRSGLDAAFALNAASFGVSAVLVTTTRLPAATAETAAVSPLTALREGLRYAVMTPLVRSVLVVTALVMLASAIRTPLEPTFVVNVLGAAPSALGVLGTAWGVGMVLGSVVAPTLASRVRRERLLGVSIAVVGVAVLVAARAPGVVPVALLWVLGGAGNALGSIAYESLLQERTPDAVRGRVIGASEATLDASYLVGILAAAWLSDAVGARGGFA
ncbi:MAG: MFS transporter, partial [Actinomycetota bacterium]|nr:MFS transporter [Actinomycetota bacterium]